MAQVEIHISDVRTFKTCRRKWNWISPLRRNLESIVPYVPFFAGRMAHYALEHYYRSGTPFEASVKTFVDEERALMEQVGRLWDVEESNLAEQVDLITGMLTHYRLWIESAAEANFRFRDENLEFISLERTFSVPLRTPNGRASNKVFLAGRFDGLVRYKGDGTYWIWETKTTRSIKELTYSLANDEQAGAYIYAAQEIYGRPISGVLYNILRKKVPTRPDVLQSGLLSKNAKCEPQLRPIIKRPRKRTPTGRPSRSSQCEYEEHICRTRL